tara:strand:- start:263 stop:1033 length:771 start_codon:yes stop_codon:yes gene_type:complete
MSTGIGAGISPVFELTPGGSVPPGFNCPTAYSLELDGISERGQTAISIPLPLLGTAGTGDFTISFWFKMPDMTGGSVNQRFMTTGGAGTDWTILFRGQDGKVQFTGPWSDIGNFAFTNNTWFHVAYSVDRSNLAKWVVNGILQDTKNVSSFTDVFDTAGTLYLGSNNAGSQRYEGNITEIAFWDKSLSASECLELYNNVDGKCYVADFTFSSNLKNYWNCFNPAGIFTDPLTDLVGATPINLLNMDASNVSTDTPL